MTASDPRVLGSDLLPTPFTAAEIREASRAGKLIRLRVDLPDGTGFERFNRFRDGDDEGATLEQWRADAPDDITARRVSWLELQRHAAFPSATTTVRAEVLDSPLGRLDCLRYDTAATDDEPAAVFWFALAHPGMPVRFEAAGTRTSVVELRGA
ncbi:hypothetical protein FVO59_06940 [Microbacterium esteraromaticum]|uniref:Uncharacterized protein n=1 Tax=Microbacterium esteraromaticum TaxID=57043 RepID=A0A7D8AKX0_9MICO|nr:hypothetical protein [Microbacterium esteraromaticum]QMU96987.1 hypothetical protein FVO59_06940 [Microbacterium esteraromaticum]